jgi:GGDEF domain-containing protein
LSIGIATFPDHAKTHKDIIKMADEAMYCGKNKSRNIVFVAS